MDENIKIFASQVKVHQRATSAEKQLNNQVANMTCSVGNSQSLFSPISFPMVPSGLMNKVAGVIRMGGYTWTQDLGFRPTKAGLVTAIATFAICQQQRPTLNLLYGTIPWGISLVADGLYWDLLSSCKAQHLFLIGIDSYSGCGFAFPECKVSI